jgi:hypothetical protein
VRGTTRDPQRQRAGDERTFERNSSPPRPGITETPREHVRRGTAGSPSILCRDVTSDANTTAPRTARFWGRFGPFFDVKNPRKIGCEPLCGHRGQPRYRTPAAGDRGRETQTASAPATASVTQGTRRNFHSGQTSSKRTPSSRTETHPGRFRRAATPSRIERTEEGIPHRLILQTAKRGPSRVHGAR